jgi:hypothetical protein
LQLGSIEHREANYFRDNRSLECSAASKSHTIQMDFDSRDDMAMKMQRPEAIFVDGR